MALNLQHFKPAENQELFYRRVGLPAVEDFLNRGVVAGTQKYGTEAYFLRGGEWSTGGAPYRITMNPELLKPLENKLYGDLSVNRYLERKGVFPIGGSSGGSYPRLTPNPDPSFLATINPMNRAGLKIDDTRTGEVLYDRTKPFYRTSLSNNLKNTGVEARILMSQPETQAMIARATKAGGASAFLLDVPENMHNLDKYRMARIEGAGSREASTSEVAQMLGTSAARSVSNAITFGMSGTSGDLINRPATGIRKMQSTGDEMSRRTMERANNWMPSPDNSLERIGISFDYAYPQQNR